MDYQGTLSVAFVCGLVMGLTIQLVHRVMSTLRQGREGVTRS